MCSPTSSLRIFPKFLRSFWTASHTTGPLLFIAPQTRVRIVDNSEFSSIAAERKVRKGSTGNAMAAQRTTAVEERNDDMVTDVRSFLRVGTSATAKRKPMVIRVYNYRDRGTTGDKVLLAVAGQKKKGWIVGCRMPSEDGWPRFESNNVVLIDDEGNPLGSRILVPIPAKLRSLKGDITKILSIATSFV
ncbi:39S ribosomal protein L14, mitochondrial [Sparganum proliferum]